MSAMNKHVPSPELTQPQCIVLLSVIQQPAFAVCYGLSIASLGSLLSSLPISFMVMLQSGSSFPSSFSLSMHVIVCINI